MDISDIHIPDQDKKILDSMRRKRVERQHGEDLAHRVNVYWEQMREEEKRLTREQKQKWQNFITSKRNIENGMNLMRLEELRKAFENNQRQLEKQIRQKDEKVKNLKEQIKDRMVGIYSFFILIKGHALLWRNQETSRPWSYFFFSSSKPE
jgi:hypothetical protein